MKFTTRLMTLVLIVGGAWSLAGGEAIDTKAKFTHSLQKTKLLASDNAMDDRFGFAVAISGDYAIIGAYKNDGNTDISGSAYIYKRNFDDTWEQKAKLVASDGVMNDQFGYSVAISGNYVIIGSLYNISNSGSAYIFKRNSDESWTQKAKLRASDADINDKFGNAVSISGDYVVIGALEDKENGIESGSAYIFKRNANESWTQKAKLLASDGEDYGRFGGSVSISGDDLIIGADGDNDQGANSGSAYIYKRNPDESWTQKAKLLASDGTGDDRFGYSVAISGDDVVIGACQNTGTGSAYVFKRNPDESWSQSVKLLASNGGLAPWFGCSVAMSGDYIVIGAYGENDKGDRSGSTYIYTRSGESWVPQATKLLASDGTMDDNFGCAVAISGSYVVIGADGDTPNGAGSGSAYIFGMSNTPRNTPPTNGIAKIAQRPGTLILDIDYGVSDIDDATVKTAMLAFKNGAASWANLIQLKTFVDGTEANLGANIAVGTHRVSWNAGTDWGVDLGNVKFTIFSQDSHTNIKQLHLIQIPAIDANPAFKINRVKWDTTDYLRAFLWLVATEDSSITYTGGIAKGVNGEYADVQLYPISNQAVTHKFIGSLMGVRPATLDEVNRAQQGFKAGVIQWTPRVTNSDGKPAKVNELNFDTGSPASADGWFVQE